MVSDLQELLETKGVFDFESRSKAHIAPWPKKVTPVVSTSKIGKTNLPDMTWRSIGNPCREITLDSVPDAAQAYGQSIGRISRMHGGKIAWAVLDEYSPNPLWSTAEKLGPLDPKEVYETIGRSLRGETTDASPFRARIQSQKQLKKRYWRNVKRMLAAEEKAAEASRELDRLKASQLQKELDRNYAEIERLRAQVASLESLKTPEKGSW